MMLSDINTFNVPIDYYSFPSGHTTAIFSVNTILAFYFPMLEAVFIALACLVGLSRLYLGVHYPSDVLIDLMIGVVFAYIVHFGIGDMFFVDI